jgi:CBS domain-containing protein
MRGLGWNRCRFGLPVRSDDVGIISDEDILENVASHGEKGAIPRVAIPEKVAFAVGLPLTPVG